ncbi:MAG TPA: hypothetical protein VJZ00_13865 [Thermoanaerobaculia bacterium]|nr:hypothetical protein [Thermoanaerobaculia bacterium]
MPRVSVLVLTALLAPLASAQHDITKVDPAPENSAIATPMPNLRQRQMKKYEIPELAGAVQALGTQLIDGRLPKPLVDFVITEGTITQRVSLFEGGLAVVNMSGGATLRKRVILPKDALDGYLAAITPAKLRGVEARVLATPERDRVAQVRVYEADGTFVERRFHPGHMLPQTLGMQINPLRDLLRAMSEDREVTSSVAGYEPKAGDELVADDQKTYRVVRVVDGANVVELKCLDAPTTIYVAKKDLNLYFVGAKPKE